MTDVSYNASNPFEDSEGETDEIPLDQENINPFEGSSNPPPSLPPKSNILPPVPPKNPSTELSISINDSTAPPLPIKSSSKKLKSTQANDSFQQPMKYVKDPKIVEDLNTPIEMSWEGVQRKELELKRREEDIQRREEALSRREESLGKPRPNNWPRCRPILHHDIVGEIPEENQRLVRLAYWGWYGIQIALIWNFVTVAAGLFADSSASGIIGSFFVALVIWLVSVPMSWLVYWFLYSAVRKEKPSRYWLFFIFVWMEILVFAYLALGVPGWGSGGFIYMIDMFDDNETVVGIFGVVCFSVWVILLVFHIYLFFSSRRPYKQAGGTEKAKQEMNTTMQNAAAEHPELVKKGMKASMA